MTSDKSPSPYGRAWQKTRKLGCWKFVLLFGVLWWGGFITLAMGIDRWLSSPEKFELVTYLARFLPFTLLGGMLIGCLTWYFSEGEYKRHTTKTPDQIAARMRWWQERRKMGRMKFALLTGGLGSGGIFLLCIFCFTRGTGFGTGMAWTALLCISIGTLLGLANWDKNEKDFALHLSGEDSGNAPVEK